MIDVGRFSPPNPPRNEFRFGLDDKEACAAYLHEFADKVAAGEVILRTIQAGQIVDGASFYEEALYLVFVPKVVVPEPDDEVALYGRARIPIDIAVKKEST
jgi:hypothetical protein